jgi:glucose dehydrogenase
MLPAALALGQLSPDGAGKDGDWRSYGRDPGGQRFSTLAEIDRGNVGRLRRAWTYHTGDLDVRPGVSQPFAFESTPLAVDGVLYLSTPSGRVIALDGDTGRSSTGKRGWPVARSSTNTKPLLLTWATAATSRPSRRTVTSEGCAGRS